MDDGPGRLRDVPEQGDRASARPPRDGAKLHGRQILRLVDDHVAEGARRLAQERACLVDEGDVDGPLRTPVELFLDRHRTLAGALAGELRWLGPTVVGIANAWVQLDAALLLPAPGAEPSR